MKRNLALLGALLAVPALVHADGTWSGDAALGYLSTTGNTESSTLNAKVTGIYKQGQWTHTGKAAAINAEKSNTATDERYNLGYRATYDFTATDYAFGTLDYENDRFAGFSERSTAAAGYGRRLLTLPAHQLDAEVGVGVTQLKERISGDRDTSAVGILAGKYQWRISPTSKFTQTLRIEQSKNNTFVNPISELKLVVVGNLFATLGYDVRYNSDVPNGLKKTDTLSSVNLGYSFGGK